MIETSLKFFTITLSTFYVFYKLNNIKLKNKHVFIVLFFSIICGILMLAVRSTFNAFIYVLLFLIISLQLKFLIKKNINFTTLYTLIALSISSIYFFFLSAISTILTYHILNDTLFGFIFSVLICCILQFISIYITFKLKRLKSATADINSLLTSNIGIYISAVLLVFFSATIDINKLFESLTILFTIAFLSILLVIWWRNHITQVYKEKIQIRNSEIYENTIKELEEQVSKYSIDNEKMSKVIHKDNKIIPAMHFALTEILTCTSMEQQKTKSSSLLNQINALTDERKNILTTKNSKELNFPSTNITSTDACLVYLYNKATKSNIFIKFTISLDLKDIISTIINENDFNTLMLDLCENAIIATSYSEKKEILIETTYINNIFSIKIYDTASHFEPNIISSLGIRRATTHLIDGGSGIGLMSSVELIKKHSASFYINELKENNLYSKCVSVEFDKKSEIRIHSDRQRIVKIANSRKDLVLI